MFSTVNQTVIEMDIHKKKYGEKNNNLDGKKECHGINERKKGKKMRGWKIRILYFVIGAIATSGTDGLIPGNIVDYEVVSRRLEYL